MAKAKAQTRMHLLEIPLSRFHLLVPSATVAEVVTMSPLTMIPGMAPWVIGVLGWRGRAVPVISFEALLMSAAPEPAARAKMVVFYPLPGRSDSEFFAMLSVREPQPRVIMDAADVVPSPAGAVESPYVASTVKLGDSTLLIPDFEALRAAFYPTPQ
jgi:chemosensory pili system protein ChpC